MRELAAIVTLAAACCLQAQTLSFERITVDLGVKPSPAPGIVAAGDFDQDGWLDMVAGVSGRLEVRLNQAGRGFRPAAILNVVGISGSCDGCRLAVADFNRDGRLDLAGPGGVLIGLGNGGFRGAPVAPASYLQQIETGDFNGDGNPDLVLRRSPFSDFRLGKGDGSFQDTQRVPLSVAGLVESIAVADFNGDGKSDVAAAVSTTTPPYWQMVVAFGQADGLSQSARVVSQGGGNLAAGDFNGDGHPDLFAQGGNVVQVMLGSGDGSFQPPGGPERWVLLPFSCYGLRPEQLVVGDWNADGRSDVFVSAGEGWALLLGRAGGKFLELAWHFDGFLSQASAGDFDGDNKLDLAGSGYVVFGNGDGTFSRVASLGPSVNLGPISHGEFNGDGIPDLAVADFFGRVWIFLGAGDGIFQLAPPVPPRARVANLRSIGEEAFPRARQYPIVGVPRAVTALDWNLDGRQDLAVVYGGLGVDGLEILAGTGDGGFRSGANFQLDMYKSPGVDDQVWSITAQDFDGDGRTDLAASYGSSGSVFLFGNSGDAAAPVRAQTGPFGMQIAIAGGDFDGDGRPDLAAIVTDNHCASGWENTILSLLLNSGTGSFRVPIPQRLPLYPPQLTSGDFDGDGKLDLAFSAPWGFAVLLGPGHGDPLRFITTASASISSAPVAADVNGDGKVDLTALGARSLVILAGRGNGEFESPLEIELPPGAAGLTVVDLNSDGKQDIAVSHSGGTLSILLQRAR